MSLGQAAIELRGHCANDAPGFIGAVKTLRALAGDDLARVNQEIAHNMDTAAAFIPDVADHLVNAGGKRIRPMLTIAVARAFGYQGDHHVKLAAAVELIHGATLLHDDVVDESALRRGAATANTIWGNKESVLVGDYIFSRAFELMVETQNLTVLDVLSRTSSTIAEGEVMQLTTQRNIDTDFDAYLGVINAKTAALFAAAAHVGALISKTAPAQDEALRSFGADFGIAYQLIDDALDYSGTEASLGKQIGDDFREGKMTLPVVFAVERADPTERKFWRRVIAEGRCEDGDFQQACEMMERCDAIADTHIRARDYAERSINALNCAPENSWSNALRGLVESSVTRAF